MSEPVERIYSATRVRRTTATSAQDLTASGWGDGRPASMIQPLATGTLEIVEVDGTTRNLGSVDAGQLPVQATDVTANTTVDCLVYFIF